MRQSRPQMIAGAIQEDLGFVFEPAKCARVNDPGAVTLKFGPVGMTLFRMFSAARVARLLREQREGGALSCFHFLARFPTVLHRGFDALMSILTSRARALAKAGRVQFFAQLTLRSPRL